MKKSFAVVLMVLLTAAGCASRPDYYNTQRGAVIGAGLGAIAGQAIGRNTEATLIGTGVGTVLGSIFGNMEDQRAAEVREMNRYSQVPIQPQEQTRYLAPEPQRRTEPPGMWVTVPGRWEGNYWVPEHQEWRPIDPR